MDNVHKIPYTPRNSILNLREAYTQKLYYTFQKIALVGGWWLSKYILGFHLGPDLRIETEAWNNNSAVILPRACFIRLNILYKLFEVIVNIISRL